MAAVHNTRPLPGSRWLTAAVVSSLAALAAPAHPAHMDATSTLDAWYVSMDFATRGPRHWQRDPHDAKTRRARARKKVAHASRVRNRPKKAKKWTGKAKPGAAIRIRHANRLARMDPGPITAMPTFV